MNLEQAQEDLYRRVASWLDQAFVKLARPLEGENAFMLELKQAHLLIIVDAESPANVPLLIYNLLADGIDVTPEVAELLLRMNYEMPFGALGVRDDGRIAFRHVLFGESLDREGLYKVLRTMADASREIEAEIWNQFSENS